jgi:hypothetical protein
VFPVLHFWSDRSWSLCSCAVWYLNYGCCLVLPIGCSADFTLHWNSQIASNQPVLGFFLASHFLVSTLVIAQDLRFLPYLSLVVCSSILPLKPLSSPLENRPKATHMCALSKILFFPSFRSDAGRMIQFSQQSSRAVVDLGIPAWGSSAWVILPPCFTSPLSSCFSSARRQGCRSVPLSSSGGCSRPAAWLDLRS